MKPCCCSAPAPSTCDICTEGSNVSIANYPGFVIDGSQFSGVTDLYPQANSIPAGCVNPFTGHSTACSDVLNREWSLSLLSVTHKPDTTCADYFGNTIACDAVTCWWYSKQYVICPDSCNYSSDIPCPYNNQVNAEIIIDASSDATYVLMYVQVTMQWLRYQCCLTGSIDGAPYSQMRVSYRVQKTAFTCLCPLCFEKFDTQLIHDSPSMEGLPCLSFPDHVRVSPRAAGATADQLAEANAHCGAVDYQPNIDCAIPEGCGHTLCTYEAQDTGGTLEWVYISGVCIEGCICPDHAALIASGVPEPTFAGQSLSVDTNCVTGDRPCSTILGRCCYTDGTGTHCVDDIDECDCYSLHSGCWDVGTGIDCAHPDAGVCTCTTPVGLCCWNDGTDHCADNVTEAECSTLSSGTGGWVEQNLAGDFRCASDHGGLANCGPGCSCGTDSFCSYFAAEGTSPTGYIWILDGDGCVGLAPYCHCTAVDDAFYATYGYPSSGSPGFLLSCSGCP